MNGTCRGSVRGNLRGTNHGNPRKYHGNCHDIFHGHLHVNCCGNPRTSTANAAAFHGNYHGNPQVPWQHAAIATELHSCCHGILPGRQTTAISTAFRGHPWQLAPQSSNKRQLPRNPTAIATTTSTDVNPLQFPRKTTALRSHLRQYCRTPRQSAVIGRGQISTPIKRNFHRN